MGEIPCTLLRPDPAAADRPGTETVWSNGTKLFPAMSAMTSQLELGLKISQFLPNFLSISRKPDGETGIRATQAAHGTKIYPNMGPFDAGDSECAGVAPPGKLGLNICGIPRWTPWCLRSRPIKQHSSNTRPGGIQICPVADGRQSRWWAVTGVIDDELAAAGRSLYQPPMVGWPGADWPLKSAPVLVQSITR